MLYFKKVVKFCLFLLLPSITFASHNPNKNFCNYILKPLVKTLIQNENGEIYNNNEPLIYNPKNGLVYPNSLLGLSLGFYANGHICYFGFGQTAYNSGIIPNKNTVFEIGSITKTFTATQLGVQSLHNNLLHTSINSEFNKLFPNGSVQLPQPYQAVTYGQLGSFYGGFPDMPDWYGQYDFPYQISGFQQNRLEDFINDNLNEYVGLIGKYNYSNVGYGLLAELLMLRDGYDYTTFFNNTQFENLFNQWMNKLINKPLKMSCTGVNVLSNQCLQKAQGYINCGNQFSSNCEAGGQNQPTGPWPWSTMAGASNLSSTTKDMVRYMQAQLGERQIINRHNKIIAEVPAQLSAGMMISHRLYPIKGNKTNGLSWVVVPPSDGFSTWLWKDGATQGYTSVLYLVPAQKLGLVLLSNTFINSTSDNYKIFGSSIMINLAAATLNNIFTTNVINQSNTLLTITTPNGAILWSIKPKHKQIITVAASLNSTSNAPVILNLKGQTCNIYVTPWAGQWKQGNCSPEINITLPTKSFKGNLTVSYRS